MTDRSQALFSRAELDAAARLVHRHMLPTPQLAWPLLCERLGARVWVKHENHTPTGAFKVRGGLNLMQDLAARQPGARLITATRGNHGQSVPFAATRHGLPVTVLVPRGNSKDKNAAMRAWGAEVVEFGEDFDAARMEADRRAAADGAVFVPSFDRLLVTGVATYALELFTAVPDLDRVYVPIGMGSGICAVMAVRDLLGLDVEVVGVVAANAPCYARSFEAGRPVETDSALTFADGLAVRVPHPQAVALVNAGAARVVTVTEDAIADAMRDLYRATHNVAEGAGAAAWAAAVGERELNAGGRVAVVLSGGNVDAEVLGTVLAGGTPVVASSPAGPGTHPDD